MGVVYKLKKEILEFILDQKKTNSGLSCRKLVDIVHQKFQVELSKSSINTILKDAYLSSPVGRRAASPQKSGSTPPLAEVLRGVLNPPVIPPVALPLAGQEAGPLAFKEQRRSGQGQHRGPLYDGMGCIFLKAVEWELSNTSILGRLLQKHIKSEGETDIDAVAETLVFMEPFGIKEVEDMSKYTKQGLWILNGIKDKIDARILSDIIHNTDDLKGLYMDFSVEIPQVFSHLSYIKIYLEDSTEIWVDAQVTSVWPPPVAPSASASHPQLWRGTGKVMSVIAREFLCNVVPVIFHNTLPGIPDPDSSGAGMSQEFSTLVSAFENVEGKRIVKIAACDSQLREMACFDSIMEKKRIFIAGVWPWQEEFKYFQNCEEDTICVETASKPLQVTPATYHGEPCTSVPGRYRARAVQGLVALRSFLIRESDTASPFMAVITNASEGKMSSQDIVSSYLRRWPCTRTVQGWPSRGPLPADRGDDCRGQSRPGLADGGNSYSTPPVLPGGDIRGLSCAFFSRLDHLCQKRFFPEDVSEMMSSIYKTPGYWRADEKNINITLLIPEEDCLYQKALESAVMRVNESAVDDPLGRRLFLDIVNSANPT